MNTLLHHAVIYIMYSKYIEWGGDGHSHLIENFLVHEQQILVQHNILADKEMFVNKNVGRQKKCLFLKINLLYFLLSNLLIS